jgi:hypothetical protein
LAIGIVGAIGFAIGIVGAIGFAIGIVGAIGFAIGIVGAIGFAIRIVGAIGVELDPAFASSMRVELLIGGVNFTIWDRLVMSALLFSNPI